MNVAANYFFVSLLMLSASFFAGNDDRKLSLLDFTVTQNGVKTDIKWSLNREPLGTFFTIEKSLNGKDFSKVIDLPVAENGNLFEEYFETDYQPHKGISYYRIKQTDDSGNAYYSETISVKFSEEQSQRIHAGISSGDKIQVATLKTFAGHEGLLVLRDSDGNDHYSKVRLGQEDNYLYAAGACPELATGIYRIVGSTNDQLYSLKLVVK